MSTTTISGRGFLERLRNATADSHTKLEALPVSMSIMNPDVTNNEYSLYLSLMQDVVWDAEQNVYPVLSTIINDLQARKKHHFINHDLQTLGVTQSADYSAPFSSSGPYSPAFSLGIMYVVEGSSLGGRVILKNIKAALGHDEDAGARYFAGYGGQTGSQWTHFLEMMTAYETEHDCAHEIIAGADFAFTAISGHFTQSTTNQP